MVRLRHLRNWLRDHLLGETPKSATMEEWAEIDQKERIKPFRYFIARTIPSWLSVKMMRLRDIRYWFVYRLIPKHKYHLVETGLKPNYHEIDTRMLHANFNMLKDFVEIELAHLHKMSIEFKKDGSVWKGTDRQAGLAHLDWEISLVHKKDELLPKDYHLIGKLTSQAVAACKKKELYIWWVEERPARIDPWDELVKKDPDRSDNFYDNILKRSKRSKSEKAASRKANNAAFKQEEKFYEEDTRMLVLLMKVRKSMWS